MDGAAIVIIGGWILCGFLAATIADSRGGSAGVGFVVGLFLGPIGVLIAFFLGDAAGREAKDEAAGIRIKCPDCAELVRAEARVCRFCGCRFEVRET